MRNSVHVPDEFALLHVSNQAEECPRCDYRASYRTNTVIGMCPKCGHQWNPFGREIVMDVEVTEDNED